ncbi:O-sialoglycoprotein endopeptidase [Calderihabitans maritimus]|uniref:N(6)-L-threonylcarbamoyladenine synthase n=1 Tax=Calderihabitans maritimus TaxID=1246530 RepID=A0A1Z5HXA6_9FIRM|nr:O-sialoglycoprotein endopeptidase [Calderihabitans maritimus]GAW94169.1 peptidase M22 glycoprotease [Calderihabitans maritimus]
MKYVLGIDTSCYTTSAALVDEEGNLKAEHRQLLSVPQGERGLQQAMAVFQHVQQLPQVIKKTLAPVRGKNIGAVVASVKPRPVEGSYMPVFTVAHSFGRTMAEVLGVPFFATTHQEGHIMAGLWSSGMPSRDKFLAVHLSGGTSELLLVERENKGGFSFAIKLLGGTTDLHAGQFIDRVGVEMGLPFPAGPHLEKLASKSRTGVVSIPSSVRGFNFSFSGPETQARKLLRQGIAPAEVARAVERCIATTLEKILRPAVKEFELADVLIVGGVAANRFIRERLRQRLEHRAVGARLFFADPRYSGDNAVGVAQLGCKML